MTTNIKDLTTQDLAVLAETLNRKYRSYLVDSVHKTRFFELTASRNPQGVFVKVILQNRVKSFYYPIEARLSDGDHDMAAKDAALFLFEYIDCYFDEYLKDANVFIPIDWTEFEYDGIPFQLKGQIFNLQLEHLADQVLARDGVVDIAYEGHLLNS